MKLATKDRQTLRQLAERYSELAHLDVQKERIERYYWINALEKVRPVVLIDEIPRGEIRDPALTNVCAPELDWLERPLRCALYQWEHFQVDLVIPPAFQIVKRSRYGSQLPQHGFKNRVQRKGHHFRSPLCPCAGFCSERA